MPEIFDANKDDPAKSKQKPGQTTKPSKPLKTASDINSAGKKDGETNEAKIEKEVKKSIFEEDTKLTMEQPARKTKAKLRTINDYSETLKQEKPSKNPLRAYAPKPLEVRFDSQMPGEEVVLMLRRHPITQVKKILIAVLLFFGPFLLFSSPMLDFLTLKLKIAVVVGWYSLLTTFILEAFLVWFFNVFIVTDERIIDVDFMSLIYKNVSSAKIDNIEDITAATGGVLASIVDYGTIYIQTAGETPQLEFEDVPHPAKITKILNELILEEEREKLEGRVR
jgi:hypothetical protein